MSNGSFYQLGLAYGTAETGLGNVPASSTPTPAPSSFYQSGAAYAKLANSDALTASLATTLAATQAAATAAASSATAASTSASSAAATLAGSLVKANNLSDVASLATTLANLGLNNVTNTSDANKPVSTAQAAADALVASNAATATALKADAAATTASLALKADASATTTSLALKAPLASPALSGVPTAPTPATADNSTTLATTAYVKSNLPAPGVSSIAGNIGAFTLGVGLTNAANDIRISQPTLSNSLGADVALSNSTTYFVGPTVSQGSSGTWQVTGKVTLLDTSVAANFSVKLWDGTTVIDSGAVTTGGANFSATVTLSGVIASPVGNIRIECKGGAGTTGVVKFNQSGNSKDCTITAVRIA